MKAASPCLQIMSHPLSLEIKTPSWCLQDFHNPFISPQIGANSMKWDVVCHFAISFFMAKIMSKCMQQYVQHTLAVDCIFGNSTVSSETDLLIKPPNHSLEEILPRDWQSPTESGRGSRYICNIRADSQCHDSGCKFRRITCKTAIWPFAEVLASRCLCWKLIASETAIESSKTDFETTSFALALSVSTFLSTRESFPAEFARANFGLLLRCQSPGVHRILKIPDVSSAASWPRAMLSEDPSSSET